MRAPRPILLLLALAAILVLMGAILGPCPHGTPPVPPPEASAPAPPAPLATRHSSLVTRAISAPPPSEPALLLVPAAASGTLPAGATSLAYLAHADAYLGRATPPPPNPPPPPPPRLLPPSSPSPLPPPPPPPNNLL